MSNSDPSPTSDDKGEDDIGGINNNKAGGDLNDKAGRDFDWMFANLNRHLAALKLVRAPGRGTLSVGEAIETTLAQAEAYENWCRFGAPGGVIEVWVEDRRVMALHPDGATDLHGVLFEAAGMPKAVVQVVRRADEIADTVVLLNRELRDVLHKGGRCEQRHPNNRHVTLEVKREGRDHLSFWVGFNQPTEIKPGGLGILERLKGKAAQARACMLAQAERLRDAWGVPALSTAAVGLVLIGCAGVAFSARERADLPASAIQASPTAEPFIAAALNVASAKSIARDFAKTNGGGASGAASKQPASGATDANKYAQRPRVLRPRLAATRVNVVARTDEPLPKGDDPVPLTTMLGNGGAAAAAESSPWDAQRLQRLSEVQSVVLKVDDATALDKKRAEALMASTMDALKELGIIATLDETERRAADGVMLLRFEPDTTLLGAIFATLRDRDGNFLWEDHAGCRISPDDNGWAATFDDASARLMGKLLPATKVASNHGERPQPVINSRPAGPHPRPPVSAPGSAVEPFEYERGRVTMTQVKYIQK